VAAEVGPEHDPLLGVRQVGLGRSVTLAMPAGPAENPAWQAGKLAEVVGRGVAWAIRPAADGRFAGQAVRQGGLVKFVIEARDANGPIDGLDLAGRVMSIAPGGDGAQPVAVPLEQTAPGRYQGAGPDGGGPLAVEVAAGGSTMPGRAVWQTVMPAAAAAEFAAVGADRANLRRLAELTGGQIVPSTDLAAFGRGLIEARLTPLWPAFLGLAAAVMLAEWALARVRRRA